MSVSLFNTHAIHTFTNAEIVTDAEILHKNVRLSRVSRDLTDYREGGYTDFPSQTFQDATLNGLPIVAIVAKNMYEIGYSVIVVTRSE